MFMTADSYVLSANRSSTTLTIGITETSYYIRNVQSPIAKQPEIIFRTLLFAVLCLEICATAFIIIKLLIIPVCNKISVTFCHRPINIVTPEHEMKSNHH